MASEKYKMFLQYMHNELGITKEDIKDWTQEAVTAVAKEYVEKQFSDDRNLDRVASRILNDGGLVKHGWLRSILAEKVMSKLEIKVKDE